MYNYYYNIIIIYKKGYTLSRSGIGQWSLVVHYRACKSRGLVFILKTSGALRLSPRYFNVEIPIQKVKFVFEDAVDEQFAELSTNFA